MSPSLEGWFPGSELFPAAALGCRGAAKGRTQRPTCSYLVLVDGVTFLLVLQGRPELGLALVHSGYQVVAEGRKRVQKRLCEEETTLHRSERDLHPAGFRS